MKRSPLVRKTPIRKVNPKRKQREFQRAYGGAEHAAWIAGQPCAVCGKAPLSQNVHIRGGGGSRKADAKWTLPGCASCHDEMHHGQKTFEAKHGIDLAAIASLMDARWEQHYAITHKEMNVEQGK